MKGHIYDNTKKDTTFMNPEPTSSMHIALISMPWSIFNRPSIQLGTLKSFLERESDYTVDAFHPYLHTAKAIGTTTYSKLAFSGWAGEALFSPLLFPEKRTDARKLFQESITGAIDPAPDFEQLVAVMEHHLEQWLAQNDLKQYDLVGFTVCFSQLLPSLYLARKIKERMPKMPIVFGGSSCSGPLAASLAEHFQEVDYVIDGEGEGSLLQLCRFLQAKEQSLPQTVHTRLSTPHTDIAPAPQRLDDLPYPDFSSYFHEMRQVFPSQPFIPVLPLEFSRGCWWNKCTFCNLNLQWHDYRFKNSRRMTEETLHLAKAYESLHFTFTDNALPPREADRFFAALAESDMDFDFFAEIRALTKPEQLKLYRLGGLRTVQVGIEALSSSLLKKMEKGTTAIDNIAAMKLCCQYGIRLEGNLITDFPTTTEAEITETLHHLDFVLPYPPMEPATFFLGLGSPIYDRSKEFSIQAILPHAKNKKLFPKTYLQGMDMLLNSYRGDRKRQHAMWAPVRQKIKDWQHFHSKRPQGRPPLFYRDGSTFLIIRQETGTGKPLLHRLRGLSRKIYLSCATPTRIEDLLAAFPKITEPALRNFINDLCAKRLMFQENGRVLSLAIRHTT